MGIDKCRNRKLGLCPMLFWQKYMSTFPVQDDPVHFERSTLSVDDYADWLKKEYDRHRWFRIVTWDKGSPPILYNLWKLKEIITPCEKVMASKGKCCRQRPISPNTNHWCRRVFKRVGSVLRLVCLRLPRSSVNFIRFQDLLQYIQEWNDSVDPEEVTRVILHVGDIANCYDELHHNGCLDGVAWALSKMPQWHRPTDRPRRAIDRYSVDRFSRKDITVGPDLTYERTRVELSTAQVLSVCEFIEYSQLHTLHRWCALETTARCSHGWIKISVSILCDAELCLCGTQVCHADVHQDGYTLWCQEIYG